MKPTAILVGCLAFIVLVASLAQAESGERKVGVILCATSDGTPKYEPKLYWDVFFKENLSGKTPDGADWHGSLRDYWYDISRGKLILTGDVTPWVKLDIKGGDLNKPGVDIPRIATEAAEAQVAELYRGKDSPEAAKFDRRNYHVLFALIESPALFDQGATGIDNLSFVMVHASWGQGGAGKHLVGIGLLAHEYGHTQDGLPDLYSPPWGHLGFWAIMADGLHGENPVGAVGYTRWKKGWLTPIVPPVLENQTIRARPLIEYDDTFKFDNGAPDEDDYLILENRQKIARDATLKREGLTAYHHEIPAYRISYDSRHVLVENHIWMLRADNDDAWGYGRPGDEEGDAFPGLKGENALNRYTFPGSQTWTGDIWWEFDNIRPEGDDILFEAHYRAKDLLWTSTTEGFAGTGPATLEDGRQVESALGVQPGKSGILTAELEVTPERNKAVLALGFEREAKSGTAEVIVDCRTKDGKTTSLVHLQSAKDESIDQVALALTDYIGQRVTLTLKVAVPKASESPLLVFFCGAPESVATSYDLVRLADKATWRLGDERLTFGKQTAPGSLVGYRNSQTLGRGRTYGQNVLTAQFGGFEQRPMVATFKSVTIPKPGAVRVVVGPVHGHPSSAAVMITFATKDAFYIVTKDWIPVTNQHQPTEIDQPLNAVAGLTGDLSLIIKPLGGTEPVTIAIPQCKVQVR